MYDFNKRMYLRTKLEQLNESSLAEKSTGIMRYIYDDETL